MLRVWDVTKGRVLRELQGHAAPIMSLDVSPDGKLAASVDATGQLYVWRLADGELLAGTLDVQDELRPKDTSAPRRWVTFAPDGRQLITAGREGLKVWSLKP
jgi:WD40 repeat protein